MSWLGRRFVVVSRSLTLIAVALVMLVGVCGALFALFEGTTLSEGIWWAVVTAPTVGYGDVYPVTPGGRAAFVLLIVGSAYVISPLIIGHIVLKMLPDPHAFTHEEQEMLKGLQDDTRDALLIIGRQLGVEDEVRSVLDTKVIPEDKP